MTDKNVKISVLIPTHARPQLLSRTLESLTLATSREWLRSVWVLENGSSDQARNVCEHFAGRLPIQYRHNETPGKSRAQQAVLPHLGSDLLLFLDDDVRIHPSLFEHYGGVASRHGPKHYFGGTVDVDYEEAPLDWLLPYLPASVLGFTPNATTTEFLGANFAAFAVDVRAVGGFDAGFGPGALRAGSERNPGGDETVLQKRLLDSGCQPIAVPDAVIWHWVPRERCTPSWALHRAQRTSMTDAMCDTPPATFAFGVPRWLVRDFSVSLVGIVTSFITSDDEKRFKRSLAFYRNLGSLQGFRLKRKCSKSTPPS